MSRLQMCNKSMISNCVVVNNKKGKKVAHTVADMQDIPMLRLCQDEFSCIVKTDLTIKSLKLFGFLLVEAE